MFIYVFGCVHYSFISNGSCDLHKLVQVYTYVYVYSFASMCSLYQYMKEDGSSCFMSVMCYV